MSAFTLDTSGAVEGPHRDESGPEWVKRWTDLSPFARGYVEALFAELNAIRASVDAGFPIRALGFSDLSPEALALILKDCAEASKDHLIIGNGRYEPAVMRGIGEQFWRDRQRGFLDGDNPRFPPLTPYLNEDGKVSLKSEAL